MYPPTSSRSRDFKLFYVKDCPEGKSEAWGEYALISKMALFIKEKGYEPANIEELKEFAKTDYNENYFTVAPASTYESSLEGNLYPYLYPFDGTYSIQQTADFAPDFKRFLAVKL